MVVGTTVVFAVVIAIAVVVGIALKPPYIGLTIGYHCGSLECHIL